MRTLIAFLVVSLLGMCACGANQSPPSDSVDPRLLAAMAETAPFPQIKQPVLQGNSVNIGEPLHLIGGNPVTREFGAWQTYMGTLNSQIDNPDDNVDIPQFVEAFELFPGDQLTLFCRSNTAMQLMATVSVPFYCQEKDPFFDSSAGVQPQVSEPTRQVALTILPAGFTDALQHYATTHGVSKAWLVASVVASVEYAKHLQHEIAAAGVKWARGDKR